MYGLIDYKTNKKRCLILNLGDYIKYQIKMY